MSNNEPPPPPPPGPPSASAPAFTAAELQQKATQVLSYGTAITLSWADRARNALAKHSKDIKVSKDEIDRLAQNGIHDPAVQRHFAWRRSLLWFVTVPTAFTALLKSITQLGELSAFSGLGVLMFLLYTLSLWAIPASVVLAARVWWSPRRSRNWLLAGFLASFPFLIVLGLTPFTWMIKAEDPGDEAAAQVQHHLIGLLGGLAMFITILPAVLSLLPGAIRACVRIKVLFPESIVPGWLLITLTPLYALLLLTLFIMIHQASGNFLLVAGMAALVAAPIAYLAKTHLFIRPLWTIEDRDRIARAQWAYLIALGVAFGLLLIYAFTGKVVGQKLVGELISYGSFTWDAIKFFVDYIGRSLFITALALDLFLLINVSVWQNTREFEKTDHAKEYEGTINELGAVLPRD